MRMNKKILIIEDDARLLEPLMEKLREEGFDILMAKDGDAGLRLAISEHPDILLLDIVMPKMNGLKMLENLREDNWGKDAKVIILTNLSDETKVKEAMGLGALEYVIKTEVKLKDIIEKVNNALS